MSDVPTPQFLELMVAEPDRPEFDRQVEMITINTEQILTVSRWEHMGREGAQIALTFQAGNRPKPIFVHETYEQIRSVLNARNLLP